MEPDTVYLRRLTTFIDVVYALIFFHMFSSYLPQIEDMAWTSKPMGLLSHLIDNKSELLRIFIGAGLAVLYWNQNNSLFQKLSENKWCTCPSFPGSTSTGTLVCLFCYCRSGIGKCFFSCPSGWQPGACRIYRYWRVVLCRKK